MQLLRGLDEFKSEHSFVEGVQIFRAINRSGDYGIAGWPPKASDQFCPERLLVCAGAGNLVVGSPSPVHYGVPYWE